MRAKLTSYNSRETVGRVSVAGEVLFTYNDFGQITADYQAHGGSVNTSTTPKVQYGYASGAANSIWPTAVAVLDGLGGTQKLAEYAYDGAKRRTVKKTYSGGSLDETRAFFYTEPSKWQVVEERVDSSTDANRQFVWGLRYIDDLVLRDRDTDANGTLDERLYALQDANWNVTALADASATIAERYAYSAYGTVDTLTGAFAARSATLYQWETQLSGYRFDTHSALYDVRNRFYSAGLGIWAQRDPTVYVDELHLHIYSSSNPINAVDPFGLAVTLPWQDPPEEIPAHCWRNWVSCYDATDDQFDECVKHYRRKYCIEKRDEERKDCDDGYQRCIERHERWQRFLIRCTFIVPIM